MAALQPLNDGKTISIDRAVILVGRAADCDAIITSSRKISRKHCCLIQADDRYLIRDLGSMNGIRVNGQRVDREAEMKSGDQVCIGDVEFQFDPNARPDSFRQSTNQKHKSAESALPVIATVVPKDGDDLLLDIESIEVLEVIDSAEVIDVIEVLDDVEMIEVLDDVEVIEGGTTPPSGSKLSRKDGYESEPVIDLDDSFADEDVDDILTFDDD